MLPGSQPNSTLHDNNCQKGLSAEMSHSIKAFKFVCDKKRHLASSHPILTSPLSYFFVYLSAPLSALAALIKAANMSENPSVSCCFVMAFSEDNLRTSDHRILRDNRECHINQLTKAILDVYC